jgi:histidinol dehydrogenase
MRIYDYNRDAGSVLALLRRRRGDTGGAEASARRILEAVRARGDDALLEYTRRFDAPALHARDLRVEDAEINAAYRSVSRAFLNALRAARRGIRAFHRRQVPSSWTLREPGLRLTQRFLPLERVGIYVPGGKAVYPSTVLMNAIPARLAGVGEIALATPPGRDGSIHPEVLVAAGECGVREIYRMGGAQAVGAFAYGTRTVPRVDKITGPGNAFVTAAKKLVFGVVGIDMLAGPTEVVIVADSTARSWFVAADMIAQAEHDEEATAVCITTAAALIPRVQEDVRLQLGGAPRMRVASASLKKRGMIILVRSLRDAAALVNEIAPEHLELMIRNARAFAARPLNAGAVFVGPWSCESLGDYVAGPNHTLPTMGTARFQSPLGVMDFMRATNILEFNRRRMDRLGAHAEVLAAAERLPGHAASIRIRREAR